MNFEPAARFRRGSIASPANADVLGDKAVGLPRNDFP